MYEEDKTATRRLVDHNGDDNHHPLFFGNPTTVDAEASVQGCTHMISDSLTRWDLDIQP